MSLRLPGNPQDTGKPFKTQNCNYEMCSGAYYLNNGQETRVYFTNPAATLPIKIKAGGSELVPWGRRQIQRGTLPLGGWARLSAVYAGRWDRWQPRPVKLDISSFMEHDIEGSSHWFDITKGKWIQGLVAHHNNERRVYVVTIFPEMDEAIHHRWPRILSG